MRQEFGPWSSFKSAPGRVSVLGWVDGGSKWELWKTPSRPSPQMFAWVLRVMSIVFFPSLDSLSRLNRARLIPRTPYR